MTDSDPPPPPPPPGGTGRRRPLPTLDLEATEIENKPVETSQPSASAAEKPAADKPAADKPAASSADDVRSEASVRTDEASGQPGGAAAGAPGRAAQDWRATWSSWRESAGRAGGALPAMPWRTFAAALAGGLVVLLGLLVFSKEVPPPNDPVRVFDMRLIRAEQLIRELAERAPTAATDPKIVEELASRLARLETAVTSLRPGATDPAAANRIATVEGEVKAVAEAVSVLGRRNDDIAAQAAEARRRADANAAALAALDKKITGLGPSPVLRGEFDALGGRLAAVERMSQAVEAELAKRPLDTPPDRAGRLALVAAALNGAVERGEPFAAELTAAKALAGDPQALAPLEPFAVSGVPTTAMLSRELSGLAPALYQAAGVAQREGGGFLERLQANAERLVRIRPVAEVPGDDPAAVITRIEVKAAHNDVAGALAELKKLPATVRAPADAWIKQAQARTAAVEAGRRFAAAALAALGK